MNQGLKHLRHEVEYAAIALVTLILLSLLVFPLFIALLTFALITGWSMVWDLDHFKKKT